MKKILELLNGMNKVAEEKQIYELIEQRLNELPKDIYKGMNAEQIEALKENFKGELLMFILLNLAAENEDIKNNIVSGIIDELYEDIKKGENK